MILNSNELLRLTVIGNIWDMLPVGLGTDPGAQGITWHKEGFSVSVAKSFDSCVKAGIWFSWTERLPEPPLERAQKKQLQKSRNLSV